MSATKQQINQRVLFEEYLKECYKNFIQTEQKGCSVKFRTAMLYIEANNTGSMCFMFDEEFNRISQGYIMDIFGVGNNFEISNNGKKFFDWAKKNAKGYGKPVSTFKTIKDTKVRAKELLQEWWGQFETTEQMFDWLEESDIMLK